MAVHVVSVFEVWEGWVGVSSMQSCPGCTKNLKKKDINIFIGGDPYMKVYDDLYSVFSG